MDSSYKSTHLCKRLTPDPDVAYTAYMIARLSPAARSALTHMLDLFDSLGEDNENPTPGRLTRKELIVLEWQRNLPEEERVLLDKAIIQIREAEGLPPEVGDDEL